MLLHFFKTAIRNIIRFRVYSFINIIGLVVGFACFFLISLYVIHEQSFDTYHEKADRIYRLALGNISENRMVSSISAGAMPFTLKQAYAGIENVVRLKQLPSLVAYKDKIIFEEKFFFTDSTFFDIFSNRLLVGDSKSALSKPYSVVLTEEAVLRYFGNIGSEVIGKLLIVDEVMSFMVTGMVENPPYNSHFHFDFLASIPSLRTHPQENVGTYQLDSWYSHYYHNYILLDKGADSGEVDRNIRRAAKLYSDPVHYERFGTNMGLFLQPLKDIHMNPLRGELEEQADSKLLYVLVIVAIMILALGSINFMNISTAQSVHRIAEVGVRKVMGATRKQMAFQFLGESLTINFIAVFLSIGLIDIVLPYFNQYFGKNISLFEIDVLSVVWLVLLAVVVGLSGGLYPALVLGNYSPIKSLKETITPLPGKIGIRRVIVVFQFAISIILIGVTFLIFSQISFMLNKDLGLNTEHVIVIPTRGDPLINNKAEAFFERLSRIPNVLSYTISELSPGEAVYGIVAKFEGGEVRDYLTTGVDYGFLDTYGIKLVAGRNFSKDQPLDSVERVIINESMANVLGWSPQEAIGKRYDQGADGENVGEIIGVSQDFNFTSLRENVSPMVMGLIPFFYQKYSIRLSGDIHHSIEQVNQTWSEVYPSRPFDFYFADLTVEQQYQKEKEFGGLFMFFACLSACIGLLGLFGIVSLELKFRAKEIGIRKVLGASIVQMLTILSKDFILLTIIAFLISIPLSYFLMNYWLEGFAYRIDDVWNYIFWPGLLVVLIATVVVAQRVLRAASINPVDTLRDE